jgi:hypothetical protein
MMQIIFIVAITLFNLTNSQTSIESSIRDFYYIELHDNTRYDENEFMQTFDTCYAINDTQKQIDECVQFAIDSYSRSNA